MSEIPIAEKLGICLFGNAEILRGEPSIAIPRLRADPRFKAIIIDWWQFKANEQIEKLGEIDLSWCNLLILYTPEGVFWEWEEFATKTAARFNNLNFICICDGSLAHFVHPTGRIYDKLDHFFFKVTNEMQFEDWRENHKPIKIFDALLGWGNPYRHFIVNNLISHGLIESAFVSIWRLTRSGISYRSPELDLYDDPIINDVAKEYHFSNSPVKLSTGFDLTGLKNGKSISHSLPTKIYNASWYTIVAETQSTRSEINSTFMTEKTAKPLYAKRLFIVFGSMGFLKRLHDRGYQTFSSVIDESYDEEPNPVLRWSMAFEQVIKLATANHSVIYKTIEPILEHNHALICNNAKRLLDLKVFLSSWIP